MQASQINRVIDFLREAFKEATVLWWSFFDWLALVEWRQLVLTWFLVLSFGAIVQMPEPATWFIFISFGVKVLAGGKRKAELMAKEASAQADVAVLERRLLEAQMATLQAQVEPHFLFNTLALIGQLIENSIKHGLEPKVDGGRIEISARVVGATLHVDVRDNGAGFDLHADEGVGLANIRERLRLLYGQQGELVIEAPPEGGAFTSIRIPYSVMETQ